GAAALSRGAPRLSCRRLPRRGDALRLRYSTDGERWPRRRLGYFPPGRVKGGVMASSPGRGGRGFAFQDIQLPPPLDKALHDLS
ncbi:DUF1349 domain-containing protein, partial [Klebsiella pneumoniae]|uniref:DUF1349 domain-containing protein n=1 Tax=Klebsiella pneumoniae TaxID=573 RepID=UPI00136FD354|nr:DUF1349 domain-containing protein [Klebsiella pneumoniae]